MESKLEYEYIIDYINGASFDNEVCCDQLRCLWTVYCLHYDIEVDTYRYDSNLLKLWEEILKTEEDTSDWSDYESFDNYMCRYLV